ncbi:lytic transglycosylase domain-containing protein [Bdellovibrio sp. HCB337]|uniref:lytic transglycosylase domain-containing protein n=1 Tax=Bdellovibrio sp. HCB337 TaxID=3394358 RepID=UPI0039A5BED1
MKLWMFILVFCTGISTASYAFDLFGLFSTEPTTKEEAAEDSIPDEEKVSTLDEDTPMVQAEVLGGKTLTGTRAFRVPDYSGQDKALGYGPTAFAVPKGLEPQVNFWLDIYSKYTTDQGLIHDTESVTRVYAEIDFKDIINDESLNRFEKERRKQRLVDDKKKEIIAILQKLDKVDSPEGLNEVEKRYWNMFQGDNEAHKFKEAGHKSRIRFQLGQKDRMQAAIFFSGRYLEDMEKIFRDAGLPIELTRLVFVESSFNVLARSKVGASGLWQIMRYTARPYRMINDAVDQRNHPMAATRLAARLMKDNYNMLKAWPLAMTGYNHGPTGVRKLTEKYKTRELVELIQNVKSSRSFGFASRNFYACFMAVLEVEKNAQKYFPKVVWSQPLDSEEIKLPISIKYKDLLTWFDGNDEKAEVFNPHISRQARRGSISIPSKAVIAIPKERYNQALISLARGEFKYAANMGPEIKAPEEPKGTEIKSADPSK